MGVLESAGSAGELFEEFAAGAGRDVLDPVAVRDGCVELSTAFVALCTSRGVAAQGVSGARFGQLAEFPGVTLLLEAHAAALVEGGVVVDWSARQFDPGAAVPLVEPLAVWRARWAPLGSSPTR